MKLIIKIFVGIFVSILGPSDLFSDSISIQFSQDFIASITQLPQPTTPYFYVKPSWTAPEQSTTSPWNFFAETINRLSLCAAAYTVYTRLLHLNNRITEINETSHFFSFSLLRKTTQYAFFVVDISAISLGVIIVHWLTKNLVKDISHTDDKKRAQQKQ